MPKRTVLDVKQTDPQGYTIPGVQIANEHDIPFQIFYGISDNARKFWSIVNARKVIGYTPEDDAEFRYARDIATFLMGAG